jgi:hypothetical protein
MTAPQQLCCCSWRAKIPAMHFAMRALWLTLIILLIAQGFLQCVSPGTLRRMLDRLGRALELTSPGERARAGGASIMQRAFGLLLLLVGLFSLAVTIGLVR